jgi:hypothetical protein
MESVQKPFHDPTEQDLTLDDPHSASFEELTYTPKPGDVTVEQYEQALTNLGEIAPSSVRGGGSELFWKDPTKFADYDDGEDLVLLPQSNYQDLNCLREFMEQSFSQLASNTSHSTLSGILAQARRSLANQDEDLAALDLVKEALSSSGSSPELRITATKLLARTLNSPIGREEIILSRDRRSVEMSNALEEMAALAPHGMRLRGPKANWYRNLWLELNLPKLSENSLAGLFRSSFLGTKNSTSTTAHPEIDTVASVWHIFLGEDTSRFIQPCIETVRWLESHHTFVDLQDLPEVTVGASAEQLAPLLGRIEQLSPDRASAATRVLSHLTGQDIIAQRISALAQNVLLRRPTLDHRRANGRNPCRRNLKAPSKGTGRSTGTPKKAVHLRTVSRL